MVMIAMMIIVRMVELMMVMSMTGGIDDEIGGCDVDDD